MAFRRTPINNRPGTVSNQARATFGSPSAPLWCRQLLTDSTLQPVKIRWRDRILTDDHEDSFMAATLSTPSTIPALQTFVRTLPAGAPAAHGNTDEESPLGAEVLILFKMGNGLNGHAGLAHGGATAAIIDASMVTTAVLYSEDLMFTLELTIKYLKPVATPGIYMTRTWLEKRSSGRKAWVRSVIEDGNGVVYCDSKALWLAVPATKL